MASLTTRDSVRPEALERLRKRADFLRAARLGKKWVTPGLIVQARRRKGDENPCGGEDVVRVGFTVTKKVGNAVIRNRVRRRLKAVAAEVLPAHIQGGQDVVIIGRMATIKRSYAALVSDMKLAVRKLNAKAEKNGGKAVL